MSPPRRGLYDPPSSGPYDQGEAAQRGAAHQGDPVIAVLDYGIGNLRSAEKALQHLGADAKLVDDPDVAATAAGMVLPGVGAFGPCAAALRATGLDTVALEAIGRGLPFLGICVGFQLLYEGSEENPDATGLGVLPGVVRALPAGVKRPQMQWNQLERSPGVESKLLSGIEREAWLYFVHSFSPESTEATTSTCDYGADLTASAEQGQVWGAQFHPEKSGRVGLRILENFVAACQDNSGTTSSSTSSTTSGSGNSVSGTDSGTTDSGTSGSGTSGSGPSDSGPSS